MKELKLETTVKVLSIEELKNEYLDLYKRAFSASERAYAPYSNFHVGAAVLLANGEIITGNNQENAAYPSGLCAERTTLFYAGSRYPDIPIKVLAIAGINCEGEKVEMITPCGACRQVILETEQRYGQSVEVLLCGKEKVYLLPSAASLLPLCFGKEDLL